ncbi:bifunctional 4-hydroxy-2-oxoglutarate aldolase/2-dehydro-3-deoxy-phosphogluconate aldolase [bacterium]|nr:bifunctional 4-hydroxy-2-oxoglutarate aldolase/2-dehydro-3-deoxy-phosphogluconate aldolase [bacterium]
MNRSARLFKILNEKRVIALLSPHRVEDCLTAYELFSQLGIVLEIAFRTEAAMEGIKALLKRYPDAHILAGTVMTQDLAEKAIDFGVSGIISADYIPAVVETCVKNDIMCVPGGLSDVGKQLSQKAELYGCEFEELKLKYPYQWIYKLFPARTAKQLLYELSGAWKGPFKGLTVIYTGGINTGNLREIVNFDPDGVFCGSALTKSIEDPERVRDEAVKWLSIIHGSDVS